MSSRPVLVVPERPICEKRWIETHIPSSGGMTGFDNDCLPTRGKALVMHTGGVFEVVDYFQQIALPKDKATVRIDERTYHVYYDSTSVFNVSASARFKHDLYGKVYVIPT